MFKSLKDCIEDELMNDGLLAESAEYSATHVKAISAEEFAQCAFPERCVICLESPTAHIWSRPKKWVASVDHGGYRKTFGGRVWGKAVPYCGTHAPAEKTVTKGAGDMPGFKIRMTTCGTSLWYLTLWFDSPEYAELFRVELESVRAARRAIHDRANDALLVDTLVALGSDDTDPAGDTK